MLERLSVNEQRIMLELLIYMAKADGKVADIEQEILRNYASLLEVDFAEIDGNQAPEDLIAQVDSYVSRAIMLQEMLRLSRLDGFFTNGERTAIINVAKMMNFPLDLVHRLDQWVLDGLRWVWHGEDLLDEVEADFGP